MNHHETITPAHRGEGNRGGAVNSATLTATPYVWRDPATIPPRQWLFAHHYIRGYVTGTIAPGGTGKTSMIQTEALSMATGRDLLGVTPQHDFLKVWLWNLEDPAEEVERRFAAAAVHHRIQGRDMDGRLFVDSGRQTPLVLASKVKDAIIVHTPVVEALAAEIKARAIDVLIIDPFVSSHMLPENDNVAVDKAVKAWAKVASLANCAVELVHHSRKLNGENISADSARGGSAFVDACRAVRVINRMSDDEAAKLGVEEHRRFFHMLSDKQNMAPPVDKRDWFQLVSVSLANGDNVAAVERWTPPNPFDDVTVNHLSQVQIEFRRNSYRTSEQAADWGGIVVAKVMEIDIGEGLKAKDCSGLQKAGRAKVKFILRTWEANAAISREMRRDEKRREDKEFYTTPADAE